MVSRLQRREVGRQVGRDQLIQLLGLGEVLQPVLAQVAQGGAGQQVAEMSSAVACDNSTCPPWRRPSGARRG